MSAKETPDQRRKRLADELARLEAEGSEDAGKLRAQLEDVPAPKRYQSPVTAATDAKGQ